MANFKQKSTHKIHLKPLCLIILMVIMVNLMGVSLTFGAWSDNDFNNYLTNYWAFEEDGTNIAIDNRGGNNFTVGNINATGGINGNAIFRNSTAIIQSQFNSGISGADARTFVWWVGNFTVSGTDSMISIGAESANDQWSLNMRSAESDYQIEGNGAANNWDLGVLNDDIAAQMIAVTYNGSNVSWYVNGTHFDSNWTLVYTTTNSPFYLGQNPTGGQDFVGWIDELAIFNKSLNFTEVSDLWNGGGGLFLNPATGLNLNSPANNAKIAIDNLLFNCSATLEGTTIENMSFWHDGTGTFHRNLTVDLAGSTNETVFNLSQQLLTSTLWGCSLTRSDDVEITGGVNRTVIPQLVTVNTETYANETTEGSDERFELNLTMKLDGGVIDSSIFYFNNTAYTSSLTSTGTNYSIANTITIPGVDSQANQTFFWSLVLEDGTNINTTSNTQTVNNFGIDDCSSFTVPILNLTLRDEADETLLSANSTIEIDLSINALDETTTVANFSKSYVNVSNARVCLQSNLGSARYSLDSTIKYFALDYATEYYNIQNFSLTNSSVPKEIDLLDLKSADSQEFKITYKDDSFIAVPDALLNIQRKYVSDGQFKTVEIPKTDVKGETLGHLVLNDVIYTITVTKKGKLLATFDNIIAECQNPSLETCEINLNNFAATISPNDYTVGNDLTFTLTYDRSTRTISSTFTIPSGVPSTMVLNATLYDNLGTNQACSDTLSSSAGSLNCVVPVNLGNGSVVTTLYKDGNQVGQAYINLAQDPKDLYGSSIVFLGLFLMLTLVGVGLSDNPMITGVFLLIGAVLSITMNVIGTGTSAFIGAGATILWLVIAVVLVLIKGAKRS